MVKHIVFIKLKDPTWEAKEELKERLLSMKNEIDLLKAIEVGLNFSEEDRAYDVALLTDFESKDDLKKYATHPYHLKVIEYIKGVALSSKVVDYIY